MKKTDFYKQAELLLRILPVVNRQKGLALKGGTAINYFYRDLPRLSVDIDLTYVPVLPRDESLDNISQAITETISDIQRTVPDIRVTPRKDRETGRLIGFLAARQSITVKVETNTVIRGTVYPTEKAPLCERAVELFRSSVRVERLSVPDLFAGKLCAALDRQHPRDLHDVKLLLENEGLTEEIRKAFIVYLISHSRSMTDLLDPNFKDIHPVFENEFQGMALQPVTLKELLDAREKLVDTIHRELTNDEKRFMLSVKNLTPDWRLLGLDGIENLPAVQWKLQNLRRMDSKKHTASVERLRKCLRL